MAGNSSKVAVWNGNSLEVVVWNVEHGSAIYAKTPNDRSILLDAGASSNFSPASWLKEHYNIDSADCLILSHPDTDHIRDIENVGRLLSPQAFYRNTSVPRKLVYPTYPPTTNPLKYYHDFNARYSAPIEDDSPYNLGLASNWGGVKMATFCNSASKMEFSKLNDYSVATFLYYQNLEFLFPGDLEAPGWEALLQNGSFRTWSTPSSKNKHEVRILVAAHHGREAGVYKPFLELYQPHLVIVSDKYGTPYSAYDTYYAGSQGYPVYDSATKNAKQRYVLSTKTNDYVLIRALLSDVTAII